MNLDKAALDRWLTREPDNGFDNFCEDVIDFMPNAFYEPNENWINDYDGQCNQWLIDLFSRDRGPEQAAAIIERAFKIFIKDKQSKNENL